VKIAITGGTGFIGRPLVALLAEQGHQVTVLTRNPKGATGFPQGVRFAPFDAAHAVPPERLEGADAVVDLAGENVGDQRWTAEVKRRLRVSRVASTAHLVEAARAAGTVRTLLVASAVGYYGLDRGAEPVTEASPAGDDFLAQVCREREAAADAARDSGTRVVPLRIGMVLHPSGAALGKLLLPFKLGLGGPMGSGAQYFSWIHREDAVQLIAWALRTPGVDGPLNVTSPQPVTNREFARALGKALRRPAVLPVPGFALKVLLGELAQGVLGGQRVLPERAMQLGYSFRFPQLDAALEDLL
jgi:uncharacterized protein (TIGR01777 family)